MYHYSAAIKYVDYLENRVEVIFEETHRMGRYYRRYFGGSMLTLQDWRDGGLAPTIKNKNYSEKEIIRLRQKLTCLLTKIEKSNV